jgi:hypothetical protein
MKERLLAAIAALATLEENYWIRTDGEQRFKETMVELFSIANEIDLVPAADPAAPAPAAVDLAPVLTAIETVGDRLANVEAAVVKLQAPATAPAA